MSPTTVSYVIATLTYLLACQGVATLDRSSSNQCVVAVVVARHAAVDRRCGHQNGVVRRARKPPSPATRVFSCLAATASA